MQHSPANYGVFTVIVADAGEKLPAPSKAETQYRYVVAAATVVSVYVVVEQVPIAAPFRKISYAATPKLSCEALHAKDTRELATLEALRFVGADGATKSSAA